MDVDIKKVMSSSTFKEFMETYNKNEKKKEERKKSKNEAVKNKK